MPDEVYTKLPSTVLAYKKAHQIGRFDPAAPENQQKKISAMWNEIEERGSFIAWPTILLAASGLRLAFNEKEKKLNNSESWIALARSPLSLAYLRIPWMYRFEHWSPCTPRRRPPWHRPLHWWRSGARPRPMGRDSIGWTQRQERRQRQGRDAVFPMRAELRGICAGESSGDWQFWQSGGGRALGKWYGGDLRRNWCERFICRLTIWFFFSMFVY